MIGNLTGTMAKRYVCKVCNKGCVHGVTYRCQETCSYCMSTPPCAFTNVRIPWVSCNRNFRRQSYFDKYKTNKLKGKAICAQKRNHATCGSLKPCHMRQSAIDTKYTNVLNRTAQTVNRTGRSATCNMKPLMNVFPSSDDVLFVFYGFETTQNYLIRQQYTFQIWCLQQF